MPKTTTDCRIEERIALDAAGIVKTADGYLKAAPKVARTGIQVYGGVELGHPEMERIRVYRPADEVFSTDSLATFAHRPLTNDHPPVMVDAKNWKKYSIGMTADEVLRDGERIRIPLIVMDGQAVTDIESGKRELSVGYGMTLDWKPGTTPEGEAYDAVMKNIRCNHIAIVDAARGGPDLRVGDSETRETIAPARDERRTETMEKVLKTIVMDGISVEVTDTAAQVLDRYRQSMETKVKDLTDSLAAETKKLQDAMSASATALKAATDAKDGEIATLKKQVADAALLTTPAAIDAMVKDRAALVGLAKKVLPAVVVDGKTAAEIRRQVVDAKLGAAATGKSDEYIAASFDTLAAQTPTVDSLGRALGSIQPQATPATAAVQAYDKMADDLTNAWKTPQAAAH